MTENKNNHSMRCRDQMYVTDLDQLDYNVRNVIKVREDPKEIEKYGKYDVSEVVNTLSSIFPKDKIVAIVHDHDVKRDEKGKPILDQKGQPIPRKPHLHIGKRSENATSLKKFAQALNDNREQNVANFDKKYKGARGVWGNLVSYLFHRSKHAVEQGKFQYPFTWGSGNFDFEGLVNATAKRVKEKEARNLQKRNRDRKASEEEMDELLLKDVLTGRKQLADMSYYEDLQEAYIRNEKKFEIANKLWLQKVIKFADLREQALLDRNKEEVKEYEAVLKGLNANPKTSENYYICGEAGSGKTFIAKRIASNFDDETFKRGVYVAGGQKNQFDNYNQQYSVVLDDVRENTYPPATLLHMTDPNLVSKYLDARYKGSATADLRCMVLTNTNSIDEFVRYIKDTTNNGDAESQYFRRFQHVYYVEKPEVISKDGKDIIVPFLVYDMKHEAGIGKILQLSKYNQRVQKFKHAQNRGLKIYRKRGKDNYQFDHYSDYYLKFVAKHEMVIPVSELDKEKRASEGLKKVTAMHNADDKKVAEMKANKFISIFNLKQNKKDNSFQENELPF